MGAGWTAAAQPKLLGDGARLLTRTMKKIEQQTGGLKRKVRDRMRSVDKRGMAMATASRPKGSRNNRFTSEQSCSSRLGESNVV